MMERRTLRTPGEFGFRSCIQRQTGGVLYAAGHAAKRPACLLSGLGVRAKQSRASWLSNRHADAVSMLWDGTCWLAHDANEMTHCGHCFNSLVCRSMKEEQVCLFMADVWEQARGQVAFAHDPLDNSTVLVTVLPTSSPQRLVRPLICGCTSWAAVRRRSLAPFRGKVT